MVFLDSSNKLWQELEGIAKDEGLKLYDVESRQPISLRIYVEKDDGKVTSQDCSRLCRRLMIFFSAEGKNYGFIEEPEIEVSSPGMNRNLRTLTHFQGAVGERVKIIPHTSITVPQEGAAREIRAGTPVIGNLQAVESEQVQILEETSNQVVALPLAEIKRAQTEFLFK